MYKVIEMRDNLGITKLKHEKLMSIEPGGMFGENGLIFNSENTYSIRSVTPVTCLVISYNDLKKEFKRLLPSLGEFFKKRSDFILERE